jgi:hypothetical protein
MRASAEWRRSMVTVLTRRALAAAWQRAGGGDAGGGDAAAGDSGGGDTGEGLCPEVGKDRG